MALSTTESEYIGLSRATQQVVWLSSFLKELDLNQEGPTDMLGNNFGSVCLTENSKWHVLMKHIEMRHHYVQEKVQWGSADSMHPLRGERSGHIH